MEKVEQLKLELSIKKDQVRSLNSSIEKLENEIANYYKSKLKKIYVIYCHCSSLKFVSRSYGPYSTYEKAKEQIQEETYYDVENSCKWTYQILECNEPQSFDFKNLDKKLEKL